MRSWLTAEGAAGDRPAVTARGVVLAASFLVVTAMASLGCRRSEHSQAPLALAPIQGEAGAISKFAGRWYAEDVLLVEVRDSEPPELAVRAGWGATVENARTVELGIQFDVVRSGTTTQLVLQSAGDGSAIVLPPGASVESAWCGTCTPHLERSTWVSRLFLKAKWRFESFLY